MSEFPQVAVQAGNDASETVVEPSPTMAAALPDASDAIDIPGLTMPSLRLTDAQGDTRPLDEIEKEVIRFAIAHYHGQMSEVARRLGIGRSTLYRKLEGLGLDDDGTEVKENATSD